MDIAGIQQTLEWLQKLPEDKRIRNIIYGFQALFTIVFASEAYKYFIGDYVIYDLNETTKIIDFFLSGRIFIPFFLFGITWFLCYVIIYEIIKLIYVLVARFLFFIMWFFLKKIPKMREGMYNRVEIQLIKQRAIIKPASSIDTYVKGENFEKSTNTFNKLKELIDKKYLMPLLLLIMLLQFCLIYFYVLPIWITKSLFMEILIKIIVFGSLLSFFLTTLFNEFFIKSANLSLKILARTENID